MHDFSFAPLLWIFWVALGVLGACCAGLAWWVPRIRGMGAIGVMYLLIVVGGVALLVAVALAVLYLLFP